MEAFLEDLLVEACAVEACCQRKLDVVLECLIAGCRPDAVGVVALVEDEPLVEGFVVEVRLVALDVNLSHADVAADAVDDLSLCVLHLVAEVVEERILGTPELLLLDWQHDDRVVLSADGLCGDHLPCVLQRDSQRGGRLAVEGGMHYDLALVDVRNDLCAEQGVGIDGFHPDCLPDACAAGVHALKLVEPDVLLSGGLLRGARVAVGMDDERMFLAVGQERRDVDGEGGASAEVTSCQAAVDEHFAVVIDGTEVEHHVAARPLLRHADVALIPDVADEVGVGHAAELAFGAEGNGNLSGESPTLVEAFLHAGANEVEGVGPVAIEVEPVLALELWARILSPGHCPSSGCHAEQQEREEESFCHIELGFRVILRAKLRKLIHNLLFAVRYSCFFRANTCVSPSRSLS